MTLENEIGNHFIIFIDWGTTKLLTNEFTIPLPIPLAPPVTIAI